MPSAFHIAGQSPFSSGTTAPSHFEVRRPRVKMYPCYCCSCIFTGICVPEENVSSRPIVRSTSAGCRPTTSIVVNCVRRINAWNGSAVSYRREITSSVYKIHGGSVASWWLQVGQRWHTLAALSYTCCDKHREAVREPIIRSRRSTSLELFACFAAIRRRLRTSDCSLFNWGCDD